jgi:hypothetical protein
VACDIVDLRIGAALGERRSRALEDPLAITAGIGAQRAMSFAGSGGLCGSHKNFIRIA